MKTNTQTATLFTKIEWENGASTITTRIVELTEADAEVLGDLTDLHGDLSYDEDNAKRDSWDREHDHPSHARVRELAETRAALARATENYGYEIRRLSQQLNSLRPY